MVNFGLIVDLRNPSRWRKDPAQLYGHTLEVCEEGDRLGVHSIWTTEHHLFDDDYLPRPLTYAAAIAARTKQARVGTAVTVAPLHPAASLAEDAAVVDLISGGRLELGLGAGYRPVEFELYGMPFAHRFDTTDRRVAEIRQLWAEGGVTPKPVQQRVPIWLGYQGEKGARRAGLQGEGLLSCKPELVEPYLAGLAEGGHPRSAAHLAGFLSFFVSDDPDRDWPLVSELWTSQWTTYRRNGSLHQASAPPLDPEQARRAGIGAHQGHFFIGTPEQAAVAVTGYLEGTPIETIFNFAGLPGMPPEMTERHLELLMTEFAPRLAKLTADSASRDGQ
jgi:alkanesulfonate monooxygenase SsuD/methylene tetrahydromethanopterin reductase-like flavin-dependent oxidoreductase (luciferase family)